MELRRSEPVAISNYIPSIDGVPTSVGGPSSSTTTSSGREVILSWKVRSQQAKSGNSEKGFSQGGDDNMGAYEIPEEHQRDEGVSAAVEVTVSKKPKRSRKPWEIWSETAKDVFFNALNEYGKDFGAIQSFFAVKVKKKTLPPEMMKNKEQVRHFYYRTWHKISKHLSLLDDVKKGTLELYALINYGELRRKIGSSFDEEKSAGKLKELVQLGITKVRVRGKTFRIRTPTCPALKKINDIKVETADRMPRLPDVVMVELRPRTGEAFARVQGLAQNPRLKATMSIQRRLFSLFKLLERKWKSLNAKKRYDLLNAELEGFPICDASDEYQAPLRLYPKRGVSLSVMKMSAVEQPSKCRPVCLSLNSHRERWKAAQAVKSQSSGKGRSKSVCSGVDVKPPTPAVSEGTQSKDDGQPGSTTGGTDDDDYYADADDDGDTTQSEEAASNSDDGEQSQSDDGGIDPVDDEDNLNRSTQPSLTVGTDLWQNQSGFPHETELCSPRNSDRKRKRCSSWKHSEEEDDERDDDETAEPDSMADDFNVTSFFELIKLGPKAGESKVTEFLARHKMDSCDADGENDGVKEELKVREIKNELTEEELTELERIKEFQTKGWTRDSSKGVTMGELFLMFGRPAKISLEYEFADKSSEDDNCEPQKNEAALGTKPSCDMQTVPASNPHKLLKRLVDFASFSLQKSKALRESQRVGVNLVPLPYSGSTSSQAARRRPRAGSLDDPTPNPSSGAVSAQASTASLVRRDDFLFRVPLGAPSGQGGEQSTKPQFKKLKKGEMIVRRIVPVVNQGSGDGGKKRAGAAKGAQAQARKLTFQQTAQADMRMNQPLDDLAPKEVVELSPDERITSNADGDLQTSFPGSFGSRKVVGDMSEPVDKNMQEQAQNEDQLLENQPLAGVDNAPPPASPSALSLLMEISFPESEVAMANQIMENRDELRSATTSPRPANSAAEYINSFSGLLNSFDESYTDGHNQTGNNLEHAVHQGANQLSTLNVLHRTDGTGGHGHAHAQDMIVSMEGQMVSVVETAASSSGVIEGTSVLTLQPANLTDLCPARTPSLSPSHVLLESDNQWLASEVMDMSFGSLLRNLDSPLKPAAVTIAGDFPSPSTSNGV